MQPQGSSGAATAFKIHAILLYLGAVGTLVVGGLLYFFNQSVSESPYNRGHVAPEAVYIVGGTLAGAVVGLVAWGLLNGAAAKWSLTGTHRTGAYVVAALNLLGFPIGTVLGVWALVALGKQN